MLWHRILYKFVVIWTSTKRKLDVLHVVVVVFSVCVLSGSSVLLLLKKGIIIDGEESMWLHVNSFF